MIESGYAHRSDGATSHLSAPIRYAFVAGLLVVGIGDLVAINAVLLPRYLARSRSEGSVAKTNVPVNPKQDLASSTPPPLVTPPPPAAPSSTTPVAIAEEGVSKPLSATAPAHTAPAPAAPAPEPLPSAFAARLTTPELPFLLFARNTAWLSPQTRETLRQVVDIMNAKPSMRVLLSGHTDDQGTIELNRELSLDRARRARAWLESNGIESSRIDVEGFGFHHPTNQDVSPTARANNRRVEITLR
jgi:outer membrane protein OmpA-like peptidoglycan-associated protein